MMVACWLTQLHNRTAVSSIPPAKNAASYETIGRKKDFKVIK